MSKVEESPVQSIFTSIDKRSEHFKDDAELAKNFTNLVLNRFSDFPGMEMVHLDKTDESVKKDHDGNPAVRAYAIWKEYESYFGAWVFFYSYEDPDKEEILYPSILGRVVKKSKEIVEDIYYIEKLDLPVVWVTYHNAQ